MKTAKRKKAYTREQIGKIIAVGQQMSNVCWAIGRGQCDIPDERQKEMFRELADQWWAAIRG